MDNVKFSALGLVKVLASVKRGRQVILSSRKYMAILGGMLNAGDDLSIVQSVCECLTMLGHDDDVELRRSLKAASR
jgi:hypothetical protein